jgi:hypothetical protein
MVLLLLFHSLTPLFRDQTFGSHLGAYNNTFVRHKLQLKLSWSLQAESLLVYVCLYAPSHCCVVHITVAMSGLAAPACNRSGNAKRNSVN